MRRRKAEEYHYSHHAALTTKAFSLRITAQSRDGGYLLYVAATFHLKPTIALTGHAQLTILGKSYDPVRKLLKWYPNKAGTTLGQA